jgi:hypothetical protein
VSDDGLDLLVLEKPGADGPLLEHRNVLVQEFAGFDGGRVHALQRRQFPVDLAVTGARLLALVDERADISRGDRGQAPAAKERFQVQADTKCPFT